MDPLNRKIFGILKKTRQMLLDLIASVYFSTRKVRLDLSTNSLHGCSSLITFLQRACGFEKKLTDRTQILLVEHIFATHIQFGAKALLCSRGISIGWLGSSESGCCAFSLQNTEAATIF
jgi:hypothetical protein